MPEVDAANVEKLFVEVLEADMVVEYFVLILVNASLNSQTLPE